MTIYPSSQLVTTELLDAAHGCGIRVQLPLSQIEAYLIRNPYLSFSEAIQAVAENQRQEEIARHNALMEQVRRDFAAEEAAEKAKRTSLRVARMKATCALKRAARS